MMTNKLLLILLAITISTYSCRDDDKINEGIEEIDRAIQQPIDQEILDTYFDSYYYNSNELNNISNPSMNDVVITELVAGESVPSGHTLLRDAIETKSTNFADQDYNYYILRVNQGGGAEQPNFSDDVRLNYEGSLVEDGEVFDSTVNPTEFDLTGLIPGWARVIPEFNIAESFEINTDGTVSYTNVGVGVMFLPSGLGYYSAGSNGIGPYKCLIFKFDLLQTEINDHDLDGIPSFDENLDSDFDINDEDTDEDGLFNFIDNDDDNDGVITRDELVPASYVIDTNLGENEPILSSGEYEVNRVEENGVITIETVTIVDSNNDGLDDYLDANIVINYNED